MNSLEFWQRRIEDFLNVLNVLCLRFEETEADGALAVNCNQLIAEIQAIHGMFEGILSADGDYMAELNYDYDVSAANDLHEEGTIGRPRKSITREEMDVCIAYISLGKKLQHFLALVRGQFSKEEKQA